MRFPLRTLILVTAVLWVSAITMFALSAANPSLAILRFAAIPDAVLATALTILSVWRWTTGAE